MEKDEFLKTYGAYLNEQQTDAVQTVQGPVLLLAVPGSGKTTVLICRLGYMLYVEGIRPENILTLTYTVAATNDMALRFQSVFGRKDANLLEFRTINGICAKIIIRYGKMIGRPPFQLVTDEKETGRVLRKILVDNLTDYPTDAEIQNAGMLITYCKNMLLKNEEISKLGEKMNLPLLKIYQGYNQYLRDRSLMDYDDQLLYAYRLLNASPQLLDFYRRKYRYICVDEAQDTSKIQHLIISLLAGENGNLFMVGDEDQSIYGFRAAYPDALLDFKETHPQAQILVMEKNYRSSKGIVSLADSFIQHNTARHTKHMQAVREGGSDVHFIELRTRGNQYNYLAKVAENCTRETAVLYRDNECVLPLVDLLDRRKIPYRIKSADLTFFTHRIVTDISNIIRFALDPYDADLFLQIYFKFQIFLSRNQAMSLCQTSARMNVPILDAAKYAPGINKKMADRLREVASIIKDLPFETPYMVLLHILGSLEYSSYLSKNKIEGSNKLFILKTLASAETSAETFLARLSYLQEAIRRGEQNEDCPFILSTIHSSKGLEYDRVYLMDVCDRVLPGTLAGRSPRASKQERRDFEEERRLFYVGMIRAKNELYIFDYKNQDSCFLTELKSRPSQKKGNPLDPYPDLTRKGRKRL